MDAFGNLEKVKVVFKATRLSKLHSDYHPQFEMTEKDIKIKIRCDISIMNPYDSSIEAIYG